MRTTVTLDADGGVQVQSAMREEGASFKQAPNDANRLGLGSRTDHAALRFEQVTFNMGPLLVTSTNLNALVDELEDGERVAKIAAGR